MTVPECSLNLNDASARVELSERGERNEKGHWTSAELVERTVDDGHLRVSSFDDDGVKLSFSAHHIENEETKRGFHASFDCTIDWKDVAILHDFLGMILKWKEPQT